MIEGNPDTGNSSATLESAPRKRRRPLWLRIFKWLGVTAAALIGVLVIVCSLAVWILTPGRLTPLVADIASKSLDAEVALGRVELTFWKSFPQLTVDVDSLSIVSRSLSSLPDSVACTLPNGADSLLWLGSFHGGINVAKLPLGELALYDVDFRSLRVNLLQVNDTVANYMIFPSSGELPDNDDSPLIVPKISVNRFSVSDAGPIRFRALGDSVDVSLSLRTIDFAGHDRPHYCLSADGGMAAAMLEEFGFDTLEFGAQGGVLWDSSNPFSVTVKGFKVDVDDFNATIDAEIDFKESIVVRELGVSTGSLPVMQLLQHAPRHIMPLVEPLETDMCLKAALTLTHPWQAGDTVLPSFKGMLDIPSCSVVYQNLHFNRFSVEAEVDFDGTDMDKSVYNLKRLFIDGRMVDVDLRAKVTSPVSDPRIEGRFKGAVNLQKIPPRLRDRLPFAISGAVEGDADFRFHLSDLKREGFHKIYAEGKLDLRDIVLDAYDRGDLFLRHGVVNFGSNRAFVNDADQRVDSLLTLSLKIDTLSANGEGIVVEAREFRAGAGTVNRYSSADTSEINPFGMKLVIERLKLDIPADTLRLRLRDAEIGGSLKRYKGETRLPQLNLRMGVDGLMFGQALTRFALRSADVGLELHMRPRRVSTLTPEQRAARRKAIADSLASAGVVPTEAMVADLDSGSRRMLMRWDFNGHVKAEAGRVITPYFPLRNRISNIDLHFSQDSIRLHNLLCKAGQSDFLVDGTVSNLRRAMLGRHNNTLGVSLTMTSDTINVNEIVRALFAGGSVAQHADSAMVWNDDDADNFSPELSQMADTAEASPLLVPRNLDARFRMKAANILYSDIVLDSFKGNLLVYDGAVNLRNLSASTDIGSIRLDGLYAAPAADDMRFGLGMKVNRFRLDRLTAIVPAIDSLLPVMKSFEGIVNADVAVTTDIAPNMDIEIPSLRAAIKIDGDSLVLLDADTFKTLSKWLFFKNKKRNMIDHMAVEVVVENSSIEIFPFMFDIDRYRLGVMGYNDLAMNLNYHVSVLKSPIPFKFGINIKGTPDNPKIRLGGAKFKENMVVERQEIADNTRINIVQQIDNVFRRGISKARMGRLTFAPGKQGAERQNEKALDDLDRENLSYTDSLNFIRQGLIENPDTLRFPPVAPDSVNLILSIPGGSK